MPLNPDISAATELGLRFQSNPEYTRATMLRDLQDLVVQLNARIAQLEALALANEGRLDTGGL